MDITVIVSPREMCWRDHVHTHWYSENKGRLVHVIATVNHLPQKKELSSTILIEGMLFGMWHQKENSYYQDFNSSPFLFLSVPILWKWLFGVRSCLKELSERYTGKLCLVSGHTLLEVHVAQPDKGHFFPLESHEQDLAHLCLPRLQCKFDRLWQDFSFSNTVIGSEDQDILKYLCHLIVFVHR